jgi:lipopolysaccharide transport system permease protein
MPNEVLTMPTPTAASSTSLGTASSGEPAANDASTHELVIRARTGWIAIDWSEIIRFRELLFFLVWRDVKVRYKQTILGFAWAVLQPLLNAVIATAIFGVAANLGSYLPHDVPYFLFAFIGQIPWQLFAAGMNAGGLSLVNQQHLLTKIYFPRLFIPSAAIGGALFDMLMAFIVLIIFMVGYHFGTSGFTPPWTIVLVPLLIVPTIIAALGMAYTLSALTVTYRDLRFIIPFMVQIWMLLSFVMFPREVMLQRYGKLEWILSLNPMYGIIQAYRGLALGMNWNPWHLVTGTSIALVLMIFGLFYFRKTERRFADIA